MTLHTDAEWRRIEPAIHADTVVIHGTEGNPTDTLDAIDAMHRAKGWAGEGYHGLISKASGHWEFHQGRPDDVEGAQAQGMNYHSVGYAVAGSYMLHLPEPAALDLLVQVVATKAKKLGIKLSHIIGHRDVARIVGDPSVATACPGDALYNWIYAPGGLRARVAKYLPPELIDWHPKQQG